MGAGGCPRGGEKMASLVGGEVGCSIMGAGISTIRTGAVGSAPSGYWVFLGDRSVEINGSSSSSSSSAPTTSFSV